MPMIPSEPQVGIESFCKIPHISESPDVFEGVFGDVHGAGGWY